MAWKKGESGNPHGRPAHPLAERFRGVVEPRLDEIITAMVDAAANGDAQAAKLLMDRVLPTFKPVAPTTAFKLDGDSLTAKAQAILAAVAAGAIAISDAKALIDAIGSLAKITEIDELERRIAALEGAKRGSGK